MQARVGLLVTDVMPIYMIMPRYSHNYAQFCQLLNSNLFTHHRILMLLREATSETYGPGSILIISISITLILFCFYFAFYFSLCISLSKLPKILFIISIRSHPRRWPWRDWQPLIALVASSYRFVQVRGTWAWPPTGLIPWFSKTKGNTYATIAASPFPLQGKPTQAQDVARRISGAVAGESTQKFNIPSTHHNPYLSHYIICLSFSSPPLPPCRFIRPLSLYSPYPSPPLLPVCFCLLVC